MAVLPATPEIAARAVSLPDSYPKDPQDRLIGATALAEGMDLVTRNRLIKKSGAVPVIWRRIHNRPNFARSQRALLRERPPFFLGASVLPAAQPFPNH
jgi:PIN domain